MLEQTKTTPSNDIISIDIDSPVQKRKRPQVLGNKKKDIDSSVQKSTCKRPQVLGNKKKGVKSLSLKRTTEGKKKTGKVVTKTKDTIENKRKRKLTRDKEDDELLEGLEPLSEDEDASNVNTDLNKAQVSTYEQLREENLRKNMEFLQSINFIQTLKQTRKTDIIDGEFRTPDYLVKGAWAIVAFEDTWYPGLVEDINQESGALAINFMHPCNSRKEKFQWPAKADKTQVNKKFVIFVTLPPFTINGGRMYQFFGTEFIQTTYAEFQKQYF